MRLRALFASILAAAAVFVLALVAGEATTSTSPAATGLQQVSRPHSTLAVPSLPAHIALAPLHGEPRKTTTQSTTTSSSSAARTSTQTSVSGSTPSATPPTKHPSSKSEPTISGGSAG